MMIKRALGLLWALWIIGLIPNQAQTPIVYGVFFYSPTCPHCHEVIQNHWPALETEFGEQLRVLFIDASTAEGNAIMQTAIEAMQIPSRGVPMLIIGTRVLVGSVNIPEQAPTLIREGLAAGGIGYPPIPEIGRLFEMVFPEQAATTPVESVAEVAPAELGLQERLLADPANLVAIVVLVGLVSTLILVGWGAIGTFPFAKHLQELWAVGLVALGAVMGVILALSLLLGSGQDMLTLALSTLLLAIFAYLLGQLWTRPSLNRVAETVIPALIVSGLLVAAYLAVVETTLSEATCGAIGNCNTVQQSAYAALFGVPIGVLGVLGYGVLLGLWVAWRWLNAPVLPRLFLAVAVFGVAFSIYLTFLEPFVIGASCAWCLTSAVMMGLLAWLSLANLPTSPRPVEMASFA